MDAFKVTKNGRVMDYRVGAALNLDEVRNFFSRDYEVVELAQGARHVIGKLEKNGKTFALKLATTEGIGARSETEKIWNDEYNKWSDSENFLVPQNRGSGYVNGLFYLIEDNFEGQELAPFDKSHNLIEKSIEEIIGFSEYIQTLSSIDIPINDVIQNPDHKAWFCEKTKSWLDSVPAEVRTQQGVDELWTQVVHGSKMLDKKPRHGDFTPWHLLIEDQQSLVLLDGEHAHSHGVEYYDICYFIQRVYSVLGEPNLALKIFDRLIEKKYNKEKLRTVLASRAIGGFLDESFKENPDYTLAIEFKNWIINL